MKKRYYFFIVIFSYLFFLIVTIPASLFTNLINKNTPVTISGISGTIWNGKASLISINNIANLDNTEWTLNGLKLLTGKAAFQINTQFDQQNISTEVGASIFKQFFINDLSARITAENIVKLTNIPLVQLSGMVTLDIDHAHWKTNELPLASGNITWNTATISVAEKVSLGNVNITLDENEQHFLKADISNKGGDLLLNGSAELIPEINYKLNMKLSPTSSASPNIGKSLSLFSKKQRNGDFLLNKTGRLDQLGLQ